MNEAIRMQLSAFVDGELPENEAELLLRRLSQDVELRQQVAEFMAIGRAMRGDVQPKGIDDLRGRVAAAIDAAPATEEIADEVPVNDRLVRPMVGFAIAASVALVAIFGLRQMAGVEGVVEEPIADIAITEPPVDDILRQYRLMHDITQSESGANSINNRLTPVDFRLEDLEEEDDTVEETDETDETTADDAATE
jgi:negative regulator of sigma E activity